MTKNKEIKYNNFFYFPISLKNPSSRLWYWICHSSPALVCRLFTEPGSELLERTLEECGNDLDYAIKSLNELPLGSTDRELGSSCYR
ncbi:hypothetical protein NE237_031229 [Protea cynaroides]|uniref:Uncharacterized protein n=1 Tax=Protea cynaroides TaxID=273540 RepID=A0A9Q0L0T6_9MAGN|nr:hypothetical protein NE237_031229 [Protea cynaroides]